MKKGAELAGRATGAITENVKNIIKASPVQLENISKKLEVLAPANKTAQEALRILNKALVSPSQKRRQSILFGLMQHPEYRKLILEEPENE